MDYSEQLPEYEKTNNHHPICLFSHRKYVEMLLFVKSFILSDPKKLDIEIDHDSKDEFNTHNREFLVFSTEEKKFGRVFGNQLQR